jgi:antitoxin CcdA
MGAKKSVNLSLDADLLAKARAEKINLSAALENTLKGHVASLEAERWKRENAEALIAMKSRIRAEGVAGDEYRSFG